MRSTPCLTFLPNYVGRVYHNMDEFEHQEERLLSQEGVEAEKDREAGYTRKTTFQRLKPYLLVVVSVVLTISIVLNAVQRGYVNTLRMQQRTYMSQFSTFVNKFDLKVCH